MLGPRELFDREKHENIAALASAADVKTTARRFMDQTAAFKYTYLFTWMGRPIIQFPQDILAMQELIWDVKPDLIVETGIAHGGSLVFYASMLELLGEGLVVGIDIDIRAHNRAAIESHPMAKRIRMIEGSSIDEPVAAQVRVHAAQAKRVMVTLDSNHAHAHVLRELQLYAPLVTKGSYLVVFDTAIEGAAPGLFKDRPWGEGNNPATAVREFLKDTDRFVIDREVGGKLLVTVAPDGYLKCIKE